MNTPNDPKGAIGATKTPLALIPPFAMEQTAWVHKLGSEKYGKKIPVYACNDGVELAEFCSCGYSIQNQRATQTGHMPLADYVSSATIKNTQEASGPHVMKEELHGQKDYVNPATTNSLGFQIQVTIADKKVLLTTGSQKIKNILESNILNTIADQKLRKEILSTIGLELFNHLGYRWKMNSEFWVSKITDAKFAVDQQEEKDYLTSTTITSLEDLEDLYVTGAIKGLACSETISSLLKKHSHTCDVQNLIIRDGEVEQYGAYNWRRTGVCATTYVAAIMRHLNAWRDGEDLDPESGISHIAHIACSCNILLDAQHCDTLQDDRYKKPTNPHCGSEFIAEEFGAQTGRPSENEMECLCGRRLIYTWNMGWACEDCHL
jgi:hypothetical protein